MCDVYDTLHTLQDSHDAGMLNVNGCMGQVWYHAWHGDYMGMSGGHQ